MKRSFLAFVIAAVFLVSSADSQDKKLGIKKSVTTSFPQGKVTSHKLADLPKFDKAISTAPEHHRPPNQPGHSWHWHPWHGWVSIPVGVAPRAVLLPIDYRLPATVSYYAMDPVQLVCPHCGNPIIVNVR